MRHSLSSDSENVGIYAVFETRQEAETLSKDIPAQYWLDNKKDINTTREAGIRAAFFTTSTNIYIIS